MRRRAILADFAAAQPGRVEIRRGPGEGFAANYLALAGDPAIRADWYAFADQDDVWHPERLARGIAQLGRPSRRRARAFTAGARC